MWLIESLHRGMTETKENNLIEELCLRECRSYTTYTLSFNIDSYLSYLSSTHNNSNLNYDVEVPFTKKINLCRTYKRTQSLCLVLVMTKYCLIDKLIIKFENHTIIFENISPNCL